MQTFSTGAEKQQWRSSGCSLKGGVWMSVDDIPCLPKHFFQHYAKLTHGLDHVSKGEYDNADEGIMVYQGVYSGC